MRGNRWDELADILVNYSTETRKGDRVLITMMETDTFPLARAVHAAAVQAGAMAHIEFQSLLLQRDLMLHGCEEQFAPSHELQSRGMEWADVYIGLRGASNPHELSGIEEERIMAFRRELGKVSAKRTEETRWVLVRVPNSSFAQQAGMSTEEMMDFFFDATLLDWKEESRRYQEICQFMQSTEKVRIVGKDTDLNFTTKGRTYVIDDGHINMPGGEVYTAPLDESAEGQISFDFPAVFAGQYVEGIRLRFSRGEVVEAHADRNEALLHQLISMDEGAKRIGEFGVGTNYGISRYCYDLLFDEKIGGTAHIALGRAYSQCGGINQSAFHWDLIKDLREEGELFLDEKVVMHHGEFVI
ncbi:MAG: aminopeptidase [SAR324 cluster bacterium]|jgi:aminopeptidase|nr:aminopeptidase [Deltaproteobacteria bacterium]MDP6092636.1 aminopeptidase [SAR324 cluster bacterium]MDP6245196.1 aminopeptidase [SAR324 cluster bacterium]MDP6463365.1 aminopeptidase [SAR324 cluster bacterium]MDP6638431.1 aminopeptidase [SAR324 cluster bacterium]|tara:strand:- start:2525 stop:3595 length:1071 start_codon:yes stop_codon:yes gene_type:complete